MCHAKVVALVFVACAALGAGCSSLLGIDDLPYLGADSDAEASDAEAVPDVGGADNEHGEGAGDGSSSGEHADAQSGGDGASDVAVGSVSDGSLGAPEARAPDGAGDGPSVGPSFTGVSAGLIAACAPLSNGTVDCWGDNASGELGTGTTTGPQTCTNGPCSTTPVAVTGVTQATGVTSGADFACALLSGGSAACWGSNASGQLGSGTATASTTALSVSGLSGATSLAASAGAGFACALMPAGAVECWGNNSSGELGDGSTTGPQTCTYGPQCAKTPVAVTGLSGATSIAAGGVDGVGFACAVLSGGTVECWGYNQDGELGNGATTGPQACAFNTGDSCSSTPVVVSGLTTATAIAAAGRFACALLSGGTVECWGDLPGTGTTARSPAAVSSLSGVTDISASDGSACALLSGGTVECWGQIAGGGATPVAVAGLTGATAITVGGSGTDFACALTQSGGVECWGDNTYGELGNGMTSNSPTPVAVQ